MTIELKNFYQALPQKKKTQGLLIIFAVMFGAVLEFLAIYTISPFLSALVGIEGSVQKPLPFLDAHDDRYAFKIAIVFGIVGASNAIFRVLILYLGQKYVYSLGRVMSEDLARSTLGAEYSYLKSKNSADFSSSAEKINITVTHVLNPCFNIVLSVLGIIAIMISLMIEDIQIALVAFTGVATFYVVVVVIARRFLKEFSKTINLTLSQRLFYIQELVRGFREIKLSGNEAHYRGKFSSADASLRDAQVNSLLIGNFPRYAIEALAIVLLSVLVLQAGSAGSSSGFLIPSLGAFAYGAQRMLPQVQLLYSGITSVLGNREILAEVRQFQSDLEAHAIEMEADSTLNFEREVVFSEVQVFGGDGSPYLVNPISLIIEKGDRLAITGPSGAGKSTFLNLVAGIMLPSTGKILVDGIELTSNFRGNWFRNVAYVPQDCYLVNGSIAQNVGVGSNEELDRGHLLSCLKLVGLEEELRGWGNEWIDLPLGDNGARLSGGQRQRVALARALYHGRKLLLLDEFTSGLDQQTEDKVLSVVLGLPRDVTILSVSHRKLATDRFESVFKLQPQSGANPVSLGGGAKLE